MSILQLFIATRRRKIAVGILAVLAIPVLALAWYLGSPLFSNVTVDEEFPRTVSADIPSDMTRSEVEAIMEGMAKIDGEMTEAMPETMESAVKISTGIFQGEDLFHKGSGQATVYALPGDEYLLRLEELSVTNGPDLHVLLSAHPDPGKSEVKDEGYIDLGKLKGNRGNQNYEIPPGIDVSIYRSVVIYCKPFHVVFSVASLSAVEGA